MNSENYAETSVYVDEINQSAARLDKLNQEKWEN